MHFYNGVFYMKYGLSAIVVAILALGTSAAEKPAAPGPEVYQAAAKYKFGDSRKPLALIEEKIRGAKPEEYKAIEARILPLVKAPDTAADAKRYFCRYLGVVGSKDSIPALAALLADEKLSDPARIALEPMADPAAGAALRQALGQVKGKLLAGMIGSVGIRKDPEAVPALAPLTGDADEAVARAALAALGAIGTPDAAKALDAAAKKAPEALQRNVAFAQATCAAALAQAGKKADAAAIYRALLENKAAPATRVAALRGLIAAEDQAGATKLILDKLQTGDAAMRTATVAAFCASTDPALKGAVVDQLPTLGAEAQAAILAVLPDQKDVPARAPLLKVIAAAKDEPVKVAALECLVTHGEAEDLPMLVGLATQGASAEASAAKSVLERMPGAGVNDAIAKLLESADAATRPFVMNLVTARHVEEAMPILVKMAAGSDAAVAAESVKALAALGTPAQVPGLVKLLLATTDAPTRNALEGAIGSICTRTTDREACAKAVLPALDSASTPVARMAVIRLLPRLKTEAALAAAVKILKEEKDPDVSQAALRALGDWPDISAAPALLDYAKTAKDPTQAVLAIRGCLRLAGLKDQPIAQRLSVYQGVLAAAARPDEKKQALAGVADVPSAEALDVLTKCLADPALDADAAQATMRLAKLIGPINRAQATAALEKIKAQPLASDDLKKQVDTAIMDLAKAGFSADGYLLAWLASGPYTQEGKTGGDLFDVAFPPEKGTQAEWRVVALPANSKGLVGLDNIFGGDNRVAYVKTEIVSPKAQDALLEIGSDDGNKVWLNGKVVHAVNTTRACKPGEDKVKISLKEGANVLLIKVTQDAGEWQLVARLVAPDGKPLDLYPAGR